MVYTKREQTLGHDFVYGYIKETEFTILCYVNKPKVMFLFTYCVSNRRFKTKLNGIKTISFICYFLLSTNENNIHLKTINY